MNTIIKNFLCSGKDCFDNDYFQKTLSEEHCAHVAYQNLSIEQNPNIAYLFYNLIKKIKPSTIIEIGTFAGGLTLFLSDLINNLNLNNTKIITYDLRDQTDLKKIIKTNHITNIILNNHNIFSDNYLQIIDLSIKNLIQSSGTSLLLCDGGCKKCEFNILSEYLKVNDIIMVHDYAPNKEYFEKNMNRKIWNWHEICDSDIIESLTKYSIVKDKEYNNFLSVAWGCFRKI